MRGLLVALVVSAACGAPTASSTPTPTGAVTTATPRPSSTAIVLPSFAQLSASSSDVVWILVAGSRLFRSTDRGSSWSEHSLPTSAPSAAISFVTAREGWLGSADSSSAPCQSATPTIWHTSDGAATWQRVTSTGITSAACVGSLVFTDAAHGFIAAIDEKSGPVVYRTKDAGKTWAMSGPLSDPPGLPMQGGRPDLQLGRVRAFGAALFLPATIPTPSGPANYVYRSGDDGATWAVAASIPSPGTLAVVTASRWLRLGPAGAAFESADAGLTWHAFTTDYAQAAPIDPEIVFGDAAVGYATVRGGLQRSVDGGMHWVSLRTPGTE